MAERNQLQALAAELGNAERVVVFTGAGMSTESGIPDFRSPGGLWSRFKPVEYQDYLASEAARRRAWEMLLEIDRDWSAVLPNRGHAAVARLASLGIVTHVITQNIDGLHQRSGIPDEQVIELHGTSKYAHCLSCRTRHELPPLKARFVSEGLSPRCDACGGLVKLAVISFGEPMPEEPMQAADNAVHACDLCLAIGSSLQVYPAAGFPILAKRNGARLVILNRDPTDLDQIADLVINAEIGATLDAVVGGVLPLQENLRR
ncbi:MAG: Sir2 family NAD-dependent protein deacetylase [Pseudomonadota bacterium]|nr:Sir2 family NAD-dependent protein deacetylase [Pseudomonadota bacterium]